MLDRPSIRNRHGAGEVNQARPSLGAVLETGKKSGRAVMRTNFLDLLEELACDDERRVYAGMGARDTPASVCIMLTDVASKLFRRG